MPEPLDEPGLLPVGPELCVAGGRGVDLGHGHDAVLGQDGLAPHAANVVEAGGHQHVGDGAPERAIMVAFFQFIFVAKHGKAILVLRGNRQLAPD